ncbi:MAG TPA: hypothetical protein VJX28_09785, partial [Chthoniobacterales bacterium]|nr:hypothetical protein [Chthoniobacterales bacterium]
MRKIVILVVFYEAVVVLYGAPPRGTEQTIERPHPQPVELLLGEPVTAWTAAYGQPRSANERNAIYQIQAGTAYVTFGNSGLA